MQLFGTRKYRRFERVCPYRKAHTGALHLGLATEAVVPDDRAAETRFSNGCIRRVHRPTKRNRHLPLSDQE